VSCEAGPDFVLQGFDPDQGLVSFATIFLADGALVGPEEQQWLKDH
jgi:hypothetical protein